MIVKPTRNFRCRFIDVRAEIGDIVISFTVIKAIFYNSIFLQEAIKINNGTITFFNLHECGVIVDTVMVELYDRYVEDICGDITYNILFLQVYKLLHDIDGKVVFTVALRKTFIH